MSIDLITPATYRAKRRHRRLADKIIRRAGVDRDDVARLERWHGRWLITVYLKDADGRPFLIAEKVVCSRTVEVPA